MKKDMIIFDCENCVVEILKFRYLVFERSKDGWGFKNSDLFLPKSVVFCIICTVRIT